MNKFILFFFILCIAILVQAKKEVVITQIEKIGEGKLLGPESLLFDKENPEILYTGIADGSIRRVNVTSNEVSLYAYSVPGLDESQRALCGTIPNEIMCGRPLGLAWDKDGNMWVADAYKGILKIPKSNPNDVQVVINSYQGVPLRFANSLVFLSDGETLFFTDSSQQYFRMQFPYVVIANEPDARVFKYNIRTQQLEVVIGGLRFANGLAVSPDEKFLLIDETNTGVIWQYELKGKKAGTLKQFNKDVGGYPDNIKGDGKGNYYVALFSETNEELVAIQKFPNIREAYLTHVPLLDIMKIPKTIGLVKKLKKNGKVDKVYIDPTGTVIPTIAEAEEHNGYLYFGSVMNNFIGRYALKK